LRAASKKRSIKLLSSTCSRVAASTGVIPFNSNALSTILSTSFWLGFFAESKIPSIFSSVI